MSQFQFGLFLLVACAVSSFCQNLQDLELEDYRDDVEMFNIGSNLPLLGGVGITKINSYYKKITLNFIVVTFANEDKMH